MAATAPAIGIVGSSDIANVFTALGFRVISGDGFRAGATAISNALAGKDGHDGSPFPIVLADSSDPAAKPWAKMMARQASRLVVVATADGGGAMTDSPDHRLEAPATVNDLLTKIGYQQTPAAIGSKYIQADASLGDLPPGAAPEPVIEQSLPAPLPELSAEPAVEPAAQQPGAAEISAAPATAAPAPTPTVEAPVAETVVDAPETAHTSAPLEDLFSAPPAARMASASMEELFASSSPASTTSPVDDSASQQTGAVTPAPNLDQMLPDVSSPAPEPSYNPPAYAPLAPTPEPQQQPQPVFDAPSPAVSVPSAAAPADDLDDTEYLRGRLRQDREPQTRRRHIGARGDVIIVGAGKGGVGKSTSSIMLAQAASEAGLSTILIDANRGQPDVSKYLRLMGAPGLRTAYDAYEQRDPAAAVMKPEEYAHARERARLDPTPFGVVLGPPSDLADPRYASARVYGEIIDYARSIADLVIVDTQIAEASKSDLWSDTFIPLLSSDAWFLGITDESGPGVSNLADRLNEIRSHGVTSARTLILASMHLSFDEEHLAYFAKRFADLGKVIGSTGIDDDFHMKISLGQIESESPSIRPTIDSILYQVTGRQELAPRPVAPPVRRRGPKAEKAPSGGGGGLFSMFGKRKR